MPAVFPFHPDLVRKRVSPIAAPLVVLIFLSLCVSTHPLKAQPPAVFPEVSGNSITPNDFPPIAHPEMKWAQGTFAKDPSVVFFNGRYFLYYSFFMTVDGEQVLTIGVATSDDLTNWVFQKNILPMQSCDQRGLGAPCAKVLDGKLWLFYQTYGTGKADAICCAWSEDGLSFTPHPQNPIFRPSGAWTNGRAIDTEILSFNDKVFLYAATRDPLGKIQMLTVAWADPKSGFGPEAWHQALDEPLLRPELPWETNCIEAPAALVRGGKVYLFYAGGYNNDPQHIGVAVSDDAVHFTRLWNIPFITNGPEGQWNASESGHPGIFVDGEQTYLFYQGNNTKGKDWYLSRVRLTWESAGDIEVPRVADTIETP